MSAYQESGNPPGDEDQRERDRPSLAKVHPKIRQASEVQLLETPESRTLNASSKRSFKDAAHSVLAIVQMRQQLIILERGYSEWEEMGYRERCAMTWKRLDLCLRDVWFLVWPAALMVLCVTLSLCFVLVRDPGGSLLSGFFLYGRTSSRPIDCEAYRNITTCVSDGIVKTHGKTELGESVNILRVRASFFIGFFGQTIVTIILNYICFRDRCPNRYLRLATLASVATGAINTVIFALEASSPYLDDTLRKLLVFFLCSVTLTWVALNRMCPPQRKVLKTWVELALYVSLIGLFTFVVMGFTVVLEVLSRRFHVAVMVMGVQLFMLLTTQMAYQLLRHMKHLPMEACAWQLFAVEIYLLSLYRTRISRSTGISEVLQVSVVNSIFHVLRALCVLLFKRWRYRQLVKRRQLREREFLTLMHANDTLTDISTEILSIMLVIPSRIMVDAMLFDPDAASACEYKANLGEVFSSAAIQITGEFVADCVIISAAQWLLGPHSFAHMTRTTAGLLLRVAIAVMMAVIIAHNAAISVRSACIFCALQAEGMTCS